MPAFLPQNADVVLRAMQYRDLDAIAQLAADTAGFDGLGNPLDPSGVDWSRLRTWYGLSTILGSLAPAHRRLRASVAERDRRICGAIAVGPVNQSRSTWSVKQVAVMPEGRRQGIGSELLRYCFETIWEARTWMLEVNVHGKDALALYRHNGFQPLAQLTYWTIAPSVLASLAEREPDLPNLMPVGNADAPLLYQLDTAAMPPHVRQAFDRRVDDFKVNWLSALSGTRQRMDGLETTMGYVFEPQRKAAIGYFQVRSNRYDPQPHGVELTVHPAYTWLYPELMAQIARIARSVNPELPVILASADYQPEREAYLEGIEAERFEHSLLLSRSVWHKLRETRSMSLDALHEMLNGWQPAKPMTGGGRVYWSQAWDGQAIDWPDDAIEPPDLPDSPPQPQG